MRCIIYSTGSSQDLVVYFVVHVSAVLGDNLLSVTWQVINIGILTPADDYGSQPLQAVSRIHVSDS